jgi:hypothetical protein
LQIRLRRQYDKDFAALSDEEWQKGKDAEELLRVVREKSDEELDIMKTQIFGFAKI